MERATRVIDHTLALLRTKFTDVRNGGYFDYDPTTSKPILQSTPERPLSWDLMLIGIEDDVVDDGRDTGDGEDEEDERDTVGISVLVPSEDISSTTQNNRRMSSTTLTLNVVVWVSIKDDRWSIRLQNAIFSVIERLFTTNRTLKHPDTGEEAAENITYLNHTLTLEATQNSYIPVGAATQSWTVQTVPNKVIEPKTL